MKIRVGEKIKPISEAKKMCNLRSVGSGRKWEWCVRVVPSTTTYRAMRNAGMERKISKSFELVERLIEG